MDRQERIERAVVELDGEWPKDDPETYHILVDVSSAKDHDGESYNAWGDGWVGHQHGWFAVCTYPEFMEARKRLENKPTEWPEGADFLVQNSSGTWQFGRCNGAKVEPGKAGWRIKSVQDVEFLSPVASVGHVFGDWRQSLERRPVELQYNPEDVSFWPKANTFIMAADSFEVRDSEGGALYRHDELTPVPDPRSAEYGEPWDSGDRGHEDQVGSTENWHHITGRPIPPVGTECEVSIEGAGYENCQILAYFDGLVWLNLYGRHPVRVVDCCDFRPVQSHRDKWIAAAEHAIEEKTGMPAPTSILEILYDSALAGDNT